MMTQNKNTVEALVKSASPTVQQKVSSIVAVFSNIKWKKVKFTIPLIPEPSHRPRLCGYRVYVPGAAKNQSFFDRNVRPMLHGLFIDTPCKIESDIFCKTPISFTKTQAILAEMGVLRPWVNSGDVDNYDKAIYDMMQPNEKRGHVGIMENYCLIIESQSRKFYSRNPRYEITITYMESMPDSIRNVMRLNKLK
jgi:Holliday junction resolvase RusA-like endonuclease